MNHEGKCSIHTQVSSITSNPVSAETGIIRLVDPTIQPTMENANAMRFTMSIALSYAFPKLTIVPLRLVHHAPSHYAQFHSLHYVTYQLLHYAYA